MFFIKVFKFDLQQFFYFSQSWKNNLSFDIFIIHHFNLKLLLILFNLLVIKKGVELIKFCQLEKKTHFKVTLLSNSRRRKLVDSNIYFVKKGFFDYFRLSL